MKTILATLCVAGLAACATPDDISTSEAALTGTPVGGALVGLMLITTPDGQVHTGALVAPSVVVTATSVVRGQNVRGITVEYGVDEPDHPTGSSRSVIAAVNHPIYQMVYLQLDSAYPANQPPLAFDTRAPSVLANHQVDCVGYDASRRLIRNEMTVTSVGSDYFNVTPADPSSSLADGDGGVPCFDGSVIVGVTYSWNTEQIGKNLGDWLPVAKYLGPIAAQSARFALHPGNGKCLDVAWAGLDDGYQVNQYTCHYQANQLWYFDTRGPYPTIVSANSGKCLTDPGVWNTPLQQQTCAGTTYQQFDWYLYNPGLAFVSRLADHWSISPSTSACLSVHGGPTNLDGVATELHPCAGTTDQRWTIEYH
jgi:hypothetical protein